MTLVIIVGPFDLKYNQLAFFPSPLGEASVFIWWITSLEGGHVNRPCGVLRHRHTSVKLLFAYTHCPSRSSDSAQGKCCQSHHEGTGRVYSLTQALASFPL